MSVNANANVDADGWVQKTKPKTKSWSIDRKPTSNKPNNKPRVPKRVVKEKVPDIVAQMLVEEVLTLVGDRNWNDPLNVSQTIANMMSIDLEKEIEPQVPHAVEIDRTVFVSAHKGSTIPYWGCQSIIRVDDKFGNRFINYKGAKYNKIDIVYENEYFKKQMDVVAAAADCTWNARWGNAKKEEHRLYRKTRTGAQSEEAWLDRCVKHLLTDADVDGINIKNLLMIEFKRNLAKETKETKEPKEQELVVTKIETNEN
jgi:hypothetical protein